MKQPKEWEKLLLRIPAGMRRDFERDREEQFARDLAQAEASGESVDPFAVRRATLTRLLEEANGKRADGSIIGDGRGRIPGERPGEAYLFRIPAETPQPARSAWSSFRPVTLVSSPRFAYVRVVLVAVFGFGLTWWIWPRSQHATRQGAQAAVTGTAAAPMSTRTSGIPMPVASEIAQPQHSLAESALDTVAGALPGMGPAVSAPTSLELLRGETSLAVYRVNSSAPSKDGAWAPVLQPRIAAWLEGTSVNQSFCVSPTGAPVAKEKDVLVVRRRDGAALRYLLTSVRAVPYQEAEVFDQLRAGVTVVVCGAGAGARTVWQGSYSPDILDVDAAVAPQAQPAFVTLRPVDASLVAAPQGGQALMVTITISNSLSRPMPLDADAIKVWDGASGKPLAFSSPLPAVGPGRTETLTLAAQAPQTSTAYLTGGPLLGNRKWYVTINDKETR